jgi:hypothetical protein
MSDAEFDAAMNELCEWLLPTGTYAGASGFVQVDADLLRELVNRQQSGHEKVEFVQQWYAERWERLRDLIHDNALHIEDEACCIMANGTANVNEPPTYAQQMNLLRLERDRLKKEVSELKERMDQWPEDLRVRQMP